jgi:hypothetical protein
MVVRFLLILLCAGFFSAGCRPAADSLSQTTTAVGSTHAPQAVVSGSHQEDKPADQQKPVEDPVSTTRLEEISFEDINLQIPPDTAFREFMLTDRAKELDGQLVRLSGYIFGGVSQLRGIKEFILLRNTECKFGPGGQADHLVRVFLEEGVETTYTDKVVEIEGILRINPYEGVDGFTWSIYDMAGSAVKHRRR